MPRYRNYKGSNRRRRQLIMWLLILIMTGAIAFFAVSNNYVVYSKDGLRIDVPFLLNFDPTPSPVPTPSVVITIESTQEGTEEENAAGTESPAPEETPVQNVQNEIPRIISASMSILKNEGKLNDLKNYAISAGIPSIAVEIKTADGLKAPPEEVIKAIEILSAPELTISAILPAFKDNTITREKGTFGIKHTSGVNWLDNGGNRWINPYVAEARQFVLECIAEAFDYGFEEVILTHVSFPYFGGTSKIGYGQYASETHISAVNTFLDELNAAFEGKSLSAFVVEETITAEKHDEAGQELSKFQEVFDSLFYDAPDDMDVFFSDGVPAFTNTSYELYARAQNSQNGWIILSPNGEYPDFES